MRQIQESPIKIIDRYISLGFLRGFLLVLSILIVLFSFLELVRQLDDVGKGTYQMPDAFIFVALTLPRRIQDMVPISTLLGSIISLGLLVHYAEIMAMQAAGMSVKRICWPILIAGTILMSGTLVLAELVTPAMEQYARTRRSQALTEPGIMLTKSGFWARQGDSLIHIGEIISGNDVKDIEVFELDDQGRLKIFTRARKAKIQDNKRWLLSDIEQKIISNSEIITKNPAHLTLDSFLSSEQVTILEIPPDSLSISDLYLYTRALKASGQNADRYLFALWQKISLPLTTGAMLLLSLPFVFGAPRVTTIGHRIVLGLVVGMTYYFANQAIGHFGLLFSLNPALTTLTPVAVIAYIAWWRLRRVFY